MSKRIIKLIDSSDSGDGGDDGNDNTNNIKNKKKSYTRPELTYTDKLTKQEIEAMLEDYEKIDDLESVPIGSHIRYFKKESNGKMKFRTGGTLMVKELPTYIMLNGMYGMFSVQIKNNVFFRRITIKEIKEEYDEKILDKDRDIEELRSLIKQLKKENASLKREMTIIKKKNIQ